MASTEWERVPLVHVLTQVVDELRVRDGIQYKQVTVRMHNKGVVLRQEVDGREIKTKRQFRVQAGQFVFSRIDARNGAMGLVPQELDGAIVSNDFPVFNIDTDRVDRNFFKYYVSTAPFLDACLAQSKGTSNRRRLKEPDFLQIETRLPTLTEQQRVVARIEAMASKFDSIREFQSDVGRDLHGQLVNAYYKVTRDVPRLTISEVAPLIRRRVEIKLEAEYPELGIRSFGKGTFHKPAIKGSELNGKRLYAIQAGDLVFNNVFAWEGAVAVVQPEDQGRFGSHRFITLVPRPGVATSDFLYFHFTTEEGLQALREASPGAAGRNRTLGLKSLERISVPIPPMERQVWFNAIEAKVNAAKQLIADSERVLDALLPSVLDKALRGDL